MTMMTTLENPACHPLLNSFRSLFFCHMPALLVGLRHLCVKPMFFLLAQINIVSQTESSEGAQQGEGKAASAPKRCCRSCKRLLGDGTARGSTGREAPSAAEIKQVMERLGMKFEEEEVEDDHRCRDCCVTEAAQGVLEEKEASMEEVAAAFSVFDRDGDGYVGPEELRDVMRRLGMEEGAEVDDCRKMIGVYDEDGDGRIDLAEFTKLLECAM